MANLNNIIQGLIDTDEAIISKLKTKVNSLTTSINTLTTTTNTLKTDLNTAKTDISTAKTNITNLQSSVNTLNTDVSTLKTNMNTANSNITTLKSDVSTLKSDMSTAKTNISNLQSGLNTANSSITSLQTSVSNLSTQVSQGSGTYGIVDINTSGRTGSGAKTTDMAASHGNCLALTSTSSTTLLYQATLPQMDFGNYALCARVKIGTSTTSNIVQLRVLNGSTQIMSKTFTGSAFGGGTTNYSYLYSTFTYEGNGSTKNNLIFQIYTLGTSGIQVRFDYAYVSMIIPSVFI